MRISDWSSDVCSSDLLPACVTPEAQAAQAEAWTAGTAYAALLHDIGKIAVDLHVEHADGSVWHPWHGPLRKPYRFRYRKEREYRLHSAATGLLYAQIGRTSCRDREGQSVSISVVAVTLNKNIS